MSQENNGADKTATEPKLEEQMTEEERNALAADEEFILGFSEEDREDPEKVEKLEKALSNAKTTIHQKRHYRTQVEELKKNPPKPAEAAAPAARPAEVAPTSHEQGKITTADIAVFRIDNPDLSKDVVDEIAEYARVTGKTLAQAKETETMKALINSRKNAQEVDEASIAPTHRPTQKIAEKDWSTATQAEIDAMRQNIGYRA